MGPGRQRERHTQIFPKQQHGQGADGGGAAVGVVLQACLDVPDLCLILVPGTVRRLDGKFLAGQAPRQQFE